MSRFKIDITTPPGAVEEATNHNEGHDNDGKHKERKLETETLLRDELLRIQSSTVIVPEPEERKSEVAEIKKTTRWVPKEIIHKTRDRLSWGEDNRLLLASWLVYSVIEILLIALQEKDPAIYFGVSAGTILLLATYQRHLVFSNKVIAAKHIDRYRTTRIFSTPINHLSIDGGFGQLRIIITTKETPSYLLFNEICIQLKEQEDKEKNSLSFTVFIPESKSESKGKPQITKYARRVFDSSAAEIFFSNARNGNALGMLRREMSEVQTKKQQAVFEITSRPTSVRQREINEMLIMVMAGLVMTQVGEAAETEDPYRYPCSVM